MANNLNPNDLEVMQILWEHGPQKPAEIQEKLNNDVKNAALRWQLRTLMENGHVTRKKVGKAFYYQAKTSQRSVFEKFTRRLINVFGGGSAVALIGRMIDLEMMSEEDIEQLRKFSSGTAGAKGKAGKKGSES